MGEREEEVDAEPLLDADDRLARLPCLRALCERLRLPFASSAAAAGGRTAVGLGRREGSSSCAVRLGRALYTVLPLH